MSDSQRIAVLTRLPEAGRNKTRLIPALGAEGAAVFHERLARYEIGRAAGFCLGDEKTELTVWIAGGTTAAGREWLGNGSLDCREQPEGDLGEKMRHAAEAAFEEGAERVVILGTDCPAVDEGVLGDAFSALDENDLVFGPAEDGGYYLVGLRRLTSAIFEGIHWGTEKVLAESLKRAEVAGVSVALLKELPDVDLPEDLGNARAELSRGETVSVVIPTFDEAERLRKVLKHLDSVEVIVADGGSADGTAKVAEENGAKVVVCERRGRAAQMNAGAAVATGEFLFFLHAETIPPEGFVELIGRTLKNPGVAGGAFRFELEGGFHAAPLVEKLVALRCRLFNMPYGDQGLFLRASVFRKLGGFDETAGPEDLEMVDRLKKCGKVRVLSEAVRTSSRKWEKNGLVRVFLHHQAILGKYLLGRFKR